MPTNPILIHHIVVLNVSTPVSPVVNISREGIYIPSIGRGIRHNSLMKLR